MVLTGYLYGAPYHGAATGWASNGDIGNRSWASLSLITGGTGATVRRLTITADGKLRVKDFQGADTARNYVKVTDATTGQLGLGTFKQLVAGTGIAITTSAAADTISASGGGGGAPAGNYGNVQLNRNSAFATPANDSLSFASARLNIRGGLSVSGLNKSGALLYPDGSGVFTQVDSIFVNNSNIALPKIGIGTATPIGSLTIDSARFMSSTVGKGFYGYHTVGQATNYSRFHIYGSANNTIIQNEAAGTQTKGVLYLNGTNAYIDASGGVGTTSVLSTGAISGTTISGTAITASTKVNAFFYDAGNNTPVRFTNFWNTTTGNTIAYGFGGTIQQSSTAGNRAFVIGPRLFTLGSGTNSIFEVGTNTAGDLTGTQTNAFVVMADRTSYFLNTLTTAGNIYAFGAKTSNYTLAATDQVIKADATGGAFNVTLPTAVGRNGQIYTIIKTDNSAFDVTVNTTASQTINGATTYPLSAQYQALNVVSDGSNWIRSVNVVGTKRVSTITSSAAPAPNAKTDDAYTITALAAAATFSSPGTGSEMQELIVRIKDNGGAQNLTWNAIYRAGTDLPLPAITTAGKEMYLKFYYNVAAAKWDLMGFLNGF